MCYQQQFSFLLSHLHDTVYYSKVYNITLILFTASRKGNIYEACLCYKKIKIAVVHLGNYQLSQRSSQLIDSHDLIAGTCRDDRDIYWENKKYKAKLLQFVI